MSRWMRIQPSALKTWFSKLPRPKAPKWLIGPIGAALGMMLIAGLAFGLGRWIGVSPAVAQYPSPSKAGLGTTNADQNKHLYPPEMQERVVAYIYGNVPVTRLELAEYLIARVGSERLEFLVNRKIVDKACQVMGIHVTDNEVEIQFRKDMDAIGPNITPEIFYKSVLKKYNKTIYEWKEDVIRPKLALGRMVDRETIIVPDEELHKRFEILYGPKVQCRMIVYRDVASASAAWQRMRDAGSNIGAEFIKEASTQFIPEMCPSGGKVPPIHRHFTSKEVENAAFNLRPGEISIVIQMPDRHAIILMCDSHVPAIAGKRFEDERLALKASMTEERRSQLMQERVVQLRKEAAPRYILARQPSFEQVVRDVQEEYPEFKKK